MSTPADETFRLQCVQAIVEEGDRFGTLAAEIAAGATPATDRLAQRVPWVPVWTAGDLVRHLGNVHRWATALVRAGTAERRPHYDEQTPADGELSAWYAAGLTGLVTALRETPPDAPAWHMSPTAPKVAASWARRQAHELAVHRMDLEATAGVPHAPLDPDLADDGVDELLTIIVPRWAHTEPLRSAQATVAVTTTDTGREWRVCVTRGAVEVTARLYGSPDAELSGTATQLLLHLWGRPAVVSARGDARAEALLRGR